MFNKQWLKQSAKVFKVTDIDYLEKLVQEEVDAKMSGEFAKLHYSLLHTIVFAGLVPCFSEKDKFKRYLKVLTLLAVNNNWKKFPGGFEPEHIAAFISNEPVNLEGLKSDMLGLSPVHYALIAWFCKHSMGDDNAKKMANFLYQHGNETFSYEGCEISYIAFILQMQQCMLEVVPPLDHCNYITSKIVLTLECTPFVDLSVKISPSPTEPPLYLFYYLLTHGFYQAVEKHLGHEKNINFLKSLDATYPSLAGSASIIANLIEDNRQELAYRLVKMMDKINLSAGFENCLLLKALQHKPKHFFRKDQKSTELLLEHIVLNNKFVAPELTLDMVRHFIKLARSVWPILSPKFNVANFIVQLVLQNIESMKKSGAFTFNAGIQLKDILLPVDKDQLQDFFIYLAVQNKWDEFKSIVSVFATLKGAQRLGLVGRSNLAFMLVQAKRYDFLMQCVESESMRLDYKDKQQYVYEVLASLIQAGVVDKVIYERLNAYIPILSGEAGFVEIIAAYADYPVMYVLFEIMREHRYKLAFDNDFMLFLVEYNIHCKEIMPLLLEQKNREIIHPGLTEEHIKAYLEPTKYIIQSEPLMGPKKLKPTDYAYRSFLLEGSNEVPSAFLRTYIAFNIQVLMEQEVKLDKYVIKQVPCERKCNSLDRLIVCLIKHKMDYAFQKSYELGFIDLERELSEEKMKVKAYLCEHNYNLFEQLILKKAATLNNNVNIQPSDEEKIITFFKDKETFGLECTYNENEDKSVELILMGDVKSLGYIFQHLTRLPTEKNKPNSFAVDSRMKDSKGTTVTLTLNAKQKTALLNADTQKGVKRQYQKCLETPATGSAFINKSSIPDVDFKKLEEKLVIAWQDQLKKYGFLSAQNVMITCEDVKIDDRKRYGLVISLPEVPSVWIVNLLDDKGSEVAYEVTVTQAFFESQIVSRLNTGLAQSIKGKVVLLAGEGQNPRLFIEPISTKIIDYKKLWENINKGFSKLPKSRYVAKSTAVNTSPTATSSSTTSTVSTASTSISTTSSSAVSTAFNSTSITSTAVSSVPGSTGARDTNPSINNNNNNGKVSHAILKDKSGVESVGEKSVPTKEILVTFIQTLTGRTIKLDDIQFLSKQRGLQISFNAKGMQTLNVNGECLDSILFYKLIAQTLNYVLNHNITLPISSQVKQEFQDELLRRFDNIIDEDKPFAEEVYSHVGVVLLEKDNVIVKFKLTDDDMQKLRQNLEVIELYQLGKKVLLEKQANKNQALEKVVAARVIKQVISPLADNIDKLTNAMVQIVKDIAPLPGKSPSEQDKIVWHNLQLHLTTLTGTCPKVEGETLLEIANFYAYALHCFRLMHVFMLKTTNQPTGNDFAALRDIARHGVYDMALQGEKLYACSYEFFQQLLAIVSFYQTTLESKAAIPQTLREALGKSFKVFIEGVNAEAFRFYEDKDKSTYYAKWHEIIAELCKANGLDQEKRYGAIYHLTSLRGKLSGNNTYGRQVYKENGHQHFFDQSFALTYQQVARVVEAKWYRTTQFFTPVSMPVPVKQTLESRKAKHRVKNNKHK